jgi:hypothetical protein
VRVQIGACRLYFWGMDSGTPPSDFRVEKARARAALTLSNGQSVTGSFFVSGGSARHEGPERVGDLLNSEPGFFPFEILDTHGPRTVLFNRDHVVMASLADHEASEEPGYAVATPRTVSLLLPSGHRLNGIVRVYRPHGHDRLSDWAHHGERFRYIETETATVVVNVDHVLEAREMTQP